MSITETTPLRAHRPDFMPANCGRTFYCGLTTILADIWLSLAAFFKANIPTPKGVTELSQVTQTAILRLSQHQRLGYENISAIKKIVENDNFKVFSDYVAYMGHRLEEIEMNPDTKVAIPFILTGMDNHIVVALFDNKTQTLEFFNSSGTTVLDTPDRQVQQTDQSLRQFMQGLVDHFNPKVIQENTSKAQFDTYNCGLYVSDFILRRAAGEEFSHICDHPLSAFETTARRTDMIGQILKDTPKAEMAIGAATTRSSSDEFEMI